MNDGQVIEAIERKRKNERRGEREGGRNQDGGREGRGGIFFGLDGVAEEEEAKKSVDLWIKWEEAERAAGEHKRAAGVQWRAMRTLEDASEYHKERSSSNG